MDSSKSPHSHPGSASGGTTGNNPPELPLHGRGSSTSKRKMITSDNNEPHEEEEEEDVDFTGLSTPTKRHQTESSAGKENEDEDTTTISPCPWRREEINLLKDILDFYHKTGRFPYSDMDDQQDFFKNWVQERRFYRDDIDLNRKMDRLNTRFLMNMEKKSNGEDIEAKMDPTEIEIFQLSNRVWGRENDDVDPNNSYEHETGDDRDAVDTKDLSFKDWIKEAGISGHGSKDSSSYESKDGSSDS